MIKKILLSTLLVSGVALAQTPEITSYTTNPGTIFSIASPVALDQSATGANTSWSYTLTKVGEVQDTYAAPTAAEQTTYPNTDNVFSITNTVSSEASRLFLDEDGATVSVTGAESTDLTLNYSTDNVLIGTFPLAFGYTNSDTVGGTYNANLGGSPVSGNFTGTATTSVDAHGTLVINGGDAVNAVRINVVQNVSFDGTGLGLPGVVIATGVQTTYNYYDYDTGDLVLRTTDITITPLLGGGTPVTTTRIEFIDNSVLNTDNNAFEASVVAYPNPAANELFISTSNNYEIATAKVYSIQGRLLSTTKNVENSVDVSALRTGAYLIELSTADGKKAVKTFIKK